jgi:hypothetical protein
MQEGRKADQGSGWGRFIFPKMLQSCYDTHDEATIIGENVLVDG